jgi:hypothetical protein
MDLPNTDEIAEANSALDEIARDCGAWIADQRRWLAKAGELSQKALKVEDVTKQIEAAASAPETRETISADPNADHTLDDFHGQQVPRSASIKMHSADNWTGELGVNVFSGRPESVAQSLRDAAADAAKFLK